MSRARHAVPWLALALAAGCGPPPEPPASAGPGAEATPRVVPAAPQALALAIGAECQDCHAEIVDDYRASGMARAVSALVPGELAGLAPVEDRATGLAYAFDASHDPPRLVESGPNGHRLEAPVAFAIGAGMLDRSYAVRLGERLWMAPLEVLHERSGTRRAALSPGHAIEPGLRFDLPITAECLGCHSDAPFAPSEPQNLAGAFEPRGISCAACHGDVAGHAAWQHAELGGGPPLAQPDPLLASRTLARHERLSICAGCHLQGDARILLEPGALGPPAPGGDLLATRAVFVAREATTEIGFVSQVERLVLSRCYLESPELDCTTCHDPHRTLAEPRERARVRAACLTCHPGDTEAAHVPHAAAARCARPATLADAGQDCVGCHMRETRVFDLADVLVHDHRIEARPPPPSPAAPLRLGESPSGDWRVFGWPGWPPPAHAEDAGLWTMALAHRGHGERALVEAARAPGPAAARLPMYHHVHASLLERSAPGDTARRQAARRGYERALALDPTFAPSAVNLGLLLVEAGEPEQALALLSRLLVRHPRSVGALRHRALARQALGDLAGFAADLEAAFEIDPRPELARSLASYHAATGDLRRAAEWDDVARGLDPAR